MSSKTRTHTSESGGKIDARKNVVKSLSSNQRWTPNGSTIGPKTNNKNDQQIDAKIGATFARMQAKMSSLLENHYLPDPPAPRSPRLSPASTDWPEGSAHYPLYFIIIFITGG